MSELEEKVLVREIGKLGSFFGGFGARRAARMLPTQIYESTVEVNAPAGTVMGVILEILENMGRVTYEFRNESTVNRISAIVGSGHMNLNPTIIHASIISSSKTLTKILIKGIAKEGIVKQQSAEKAVKRMADQLTQRYA